MCREPEDSGVVMGANLSKQPRIEAAKLAVVIGVLCHWLQRVVDDQHNPPKSKKEGSAPPAPQAAPSGGSKGMAKTPSMVNLMRSERLSRAKELERSVPRSYRMALASFAKCFVAIGVLDVLFARHSKVFWLGGAVAAPWWHQLCLTFCCCYLVSKARFFALHALVNAIVTIKAIPDTIKTAFHPVSSMEGRCNVIPACVVKCFLKDLSHDSCSNGARFGRYMILTLFIYHVVCFKNVGYDEWWHHILFGELTTSLVLPSMHLLLNRVLMWFAPWQALALAVLDYTIAPAHSRMLSVSLYLVFLEVCEARDVQHCSTSCKLRRCVLKLRRLVVCRC